MIPQGKGMFIWILDRLGSPQNVADLAEAAGFDWVAIKVQSGRLVSDSRKVSEFEAQKPELYFEALRAKGIKCHVWGYLFTTSDVQADLEVQKAVEACARFKPESYIINAEVEYKSIPKSRATWLVQNIKKLLTIPVGFSSYRFPTIHREFPFSSFKGCDYAVPQVYWLLDNRDNAPTIQVDRMVKEHKDIFGNMPLVPAGSAYPHGSWTPTVTQIDDFNRACKDHNFPAHLWWEWLYAISRSDWWNAISAHDSNGTVPVNPPVAENPDFSGVISEMESATMILTDSINKLKNMEDK